MIVGTAGHIDHGKTALVKALTGVDTDRLKEEKARGITVDLGFAYSGQGEHECIDPLHHRHFGTGHLLYRDRPDTGDAAVNFVGYHYHRAGIA